MERFYLTIGDFRKNSGIVGMLYLLNEAGAKEGIDYGESEDQNSLWIDTNFALAQDWTDLYFQTFVKRLGHMSAYERVMDKIDSLLRKLKSDTWKMEKTEKEELKFINDKLLSNSYQSGFQTIKDRIDNQEVYERLKKEKLKDKMGQEELMERLEGLQSFLNQDLCKETFVMKSLFYNYINRFWDGVSLLSQNKAKKEMREMFEKDFVEPFLNYLKADHTKAKNSCIDCGNAINTKEKVSIAFMVGCADDLSRKKSAFWNGKVDAYLCPVCAFVYAVSPLGFQLYRDKFVFLNTSDTIEQLKYSNYKEQINENEQKEDEKYSSWIVRMLDAVITEKKKQLSNLPVVIRGFDSSEGYQFQIIQNDVLEILENEGVKKSLEKLQKYPIIKMKNEFWNVYEKVVWNILNYQTQYYLLNQLLKESLDNNGLIYNALLVKEVQRHTNMQLKNMRNEEGVKQMVYDSYFMTKNGYDLRKELISNKNAKDDECLRGTIYQLLNALSVKNKERFFDIILRLYCSTKKEVPNGFSKMIHDQEKFIDYGYAFVIGLKGGFFEKDSEKENK